MRNYEMSTDHDLKALLDYGTPGFPYIRFDDDIARYKGGCIDWHWHDQLEFVLVTSNSVICDIDGITLTVPKDSGLFINSGVIHSFRTSTDGTMCSFLFTPHFIAPTQSLAYKRFVLPVISSGLRYCALSPKVAWQKDILDMLFANARSASEERELYELDIQIFVLEIWRILFENLKTLIAQTPDNRTIRLQNRMHLMLEYIANNYQYSISVDDIARSAAISTSEAQRCFHTAIQSTPIRYVLEYRLGEAHRLLQATDLPISTIAANTGFESISYFDRQYRKQFGISPSTTRKNCRHTFASKSK